MIRILLLLLSLLDLSGLTQTAYATDDLKAVIRDALENALQNQVEHLFSVWLKDSRGQPERAATGIRRAVTAYRHALEAISKEEFANGLASETDTDVDRVRRDRLSPVRSSQAGWRQHSRR